MPSNLGGTEVPGIMEIGRTGIVVLEYGAGAARNFAFADLKPGTFAIPPCEFCQVSIVAFFPYADPFDMMPELAIAGTLLEGTHKHAARFTSTLIARVQPGKSFKLPTPPLARWVDFEGGRAENSSNVVTSAMVRFLEEHTDRDQFAGGPFQSVGSGRYIVRDEANGIYPEPMPVELSSPGGDFSFFRVWNDGAFSAAVTVKFFLEL
jgi:hypothetical protein